MTSFVESCIETVEESARSLERRTRGRPQAQKLLKSLANKKNILVTTHLHPDPDALASAHALTVLLKAKLPNAKVTGSIRGQVVGGINEAFATHSQLSFAEWDAEKVASGTYDAVVLLDCQPTFAYNPLPKEVEVTAVIDHHRPRGRRPTCSHCDVRTDVGATSSIVFSYFMELEETIPPLLAATLLYAIESDLAGAAGTPGELDNMALSGLTLLADTKALYKMRYVRLTPSYFEVFASSFTSAVVYDRLVVSHLTKIDTLEKPALVADTLLRLKGVDYSLVTALHEGRMVISLRASITSALSAADAMARLIRGLGEGGGHRTKAGGFVPLGNPLDVAQVEKIRTLLRNRLLKVLGIPTSKATPLVPAPQNGR